MAIDVMAYGANSFGQAVYVDHTGERMIEELPAVLSAVYGPIREADEPAYVKARKSAFDAYMNEDSGDDWPDDEEDHSFVHYSFID